MNQDQLVQFLSDIYEKECTFKIDKDEIEFIRNGVETLSEKIVDKLLQFKPSVDTDTLINVAINAPKRILDRSIITFTEVGGKATKCEKCKFLKVGSFYEGTRNKFPNEFDLIFPLYHLETSATMAGRLGDDVISISEHSLMFHNTTMTKMKTLGSGDLFLECSERKDMALESNDRSKRLKFLKMVGTFGPALTIQLQYANKNTDERDIFVDLVAVTTLTGDNLTAIVNEHCVLKPFKDKICETGRVLVVKKRVSFTETEVDVMKTLSRCHKMVYKLLKYFIHGEDDAIKHTRLFNKERYQEYSSYILKMFMIHHHYSCSADTTDVTHYSSDTTDVTQYAADTTDVTKCSADTIDVKQCSADTTDVTHCSADTTDVTQCAADSTDVTQCSADTTNVTKCSDDTTDVTKGSADFIDQSQCSGDSIVTDKCQGHTERNSIITETRNCGDSDVDNPMVSSETIDKETCPGDAKKDKTYPGNAIANRTCSDEAVLRVAFSGDVIEHRTFSYDEIPNSTISSGALGKEPFSGDVIEKEKYFQDAIANVPIPSEETKFGAISHNAIAKENGEYIANTIHRRQYSGCSYYIGQCLLTILDEICKHENTESLPSLSKKDMYTTDDKRELFLLSYLKELRDDLRSILKSTDLYDYDRLRSKRSFTRSVNARYNFDHPTETVKCATNPRKRTTRKFPTLEDMRACGLLKKP